MFKVIIFFILSILLAVLCAISIFRNFLSQYRVGGNGFITILVLLLSVAALVYCFGGILGATYLQESIIKLQSSANMAPDDLEVLKQSIESAPREILKCLGIGYAFLAAHITLIKIIQRKIDNKIKSNSVKRWKL